MLRLIEFFEVPVVCGYVTGASRGARQDLQCMVSNSYFTIFPAVRVASAPSAGLVVSEWVIWTRLAVGSCTECRVDGEGVVTTQRYQPAIFLLLGIERSIREPSGA